MNSYETYQYYLALKFHFTSDYDYFKYQGKVKASVNAFEKRKDKYFFYKLSKKKEPDVHILSNFVYGNPKAWIGDITKGDDYYMAFKNMQESLTYNFKQDVGELKDDFKENFIVKDGQHPHLLHLYVRKKVRLESLMILDEITGCLDKWNVKIQDTSIWSDVYKKTSKYKGFFDLYFPHEVCKMKEILKNKYV